MLVKCYQPLSELWWPSPLWRSKYLGRLCCILPWLTSELPGLLGHWRLRRSHHLGFDQTRQQAEQQGKQKPISTSLCECSQRCEKQTNNFNVFFSFIHRFIMVYQFIGGESQPISREILKIYFLLVISPEVFFLIYPNNFNNLFLYIHKEVCPYDFLRSRCWSHLESFLV